MKRDRKINFNNLSLVSRAVNAALMASVCYTSGVMAQEQNDKDVEVVMVTGSYVARDAQSSMSSPIHIMGAEEIAKSGFTGIDDLIVLNPANIGSVGGVNNLAGGGAENRSTRSANLRGLGPSSTLVLLNGHRVSSQEQDARRNSYTNLAALVPTIAVKQIETVLDGASAIYGSDAIAGAMNVITDNYYDGFAASWQHTAIENAPAKMFQMKLGGGTDKFHGVISTSYEYKDNLQNADRPFTATDNTSGTSQPGNYVLTARPVNADGSDVIINNGVNGAINYSSLYDQISAATGSERVRIADPHCTVEGTGGIYVGSEAFPQGTCQFSYQAMNPISPESKVWLTHATANYFLTDTQELYFEGRHYKQGSVRYGVASMPISLGTPVVPADNPYNPFGVDAEFTGRVLGVNADHREEHVDVNGTHLVLGLKGDIASTHWQYNINGVWSTEKAVTTAPDTDIGMLQNALDGFGGADCRIDPYGNPDPSETAGEGNCIYFSPFGADQLNHDERVFHNLLQPAIFSDEVEYQILEFVVNGELFELPGGVTGIAIGGQTRKETRTVGVDSSTQAGRWGFTGKQSPGKGSRTIDGVFVELFLPWTLDIETQLAIRYEDYGQFTTTDPKLGINWRATDDLTLRLSASTAFRAPSLAHSVGNQSSSGVAQTVDPLDPNDQGTFRVINTIANPDLEPEESTNINIGATWNPLDSLTLSLDYWSFEFENQVTAESATQVIQADPNGPNLIRDSSGKLLAVNVGYFNSGKTETNGLDFRVAYEKEIFDGHHFSLTNSLSWINEYTVQTGQDQPVYDVVGRRNDNNPGSVAPEFRNTMQASWQHHNHNANITMRYTDAVEDDVFLPMDYAEPWGIIPSSTVFDAQYSYRFGDNQQYQVAIGALNLFDREPPAAFFTKYLSTAADPLGRQAYLKLSVEM
jgi:iron complex outermembrane recepter protein